MLQQKFHEFYSSGRCKVREAGKNENYDPRKVQQLITQFYLKQRRVLVKNSRFFSATVLTTTQFTRVM